MSPEELQSENKRLGKSVVELRHRVWELAEAVDAAEAWIDQNTNCVQHTEWLLSPNYRAMREARKV